MASTSPEHSKSMWGGYWNSIGGCPSCGHYEVEGNRSPLCNGCGKQAMTESLAMRAPAKTMSISPDRVPVGGDVA